MRLMLMLFVENIYLNPYMFFYFGPMWLMLMLFVKTDLTLQFYSVYNLADEALA